ncbi:protoheme IX farnesyltransferase [Melioribacter sp. OK-1-Me]
MKTLVIASLKNMWEVFFELAKVRITAFVAMSTSVGYILYAETISWQMLIVTFGVFLMACGSSIINEIQEREKDKLMDRTKGRPLPSGRISVQAASTIAILLIIAAGIIIFYSANLTALIFSFIALIWYNIIYTPLKRVNALAIIPGSLIGAIPPVIGYTAAGGSPIDLQILSLALFFFIWQIPHFWLLLLLYSKDYEKAGFPVLTTNFSESQLGRITYVWIVALAVSSLFIPFYSVNFRIYTFIAFLLLSGWLIFDTRCMLKSFLYNKTIGTKKVLFKEAFIKINLFVLVVSVIISISKLFLTEI